MSPVIRLSDTVYERLGAHAQGFEPPANVIERLLDQVEGVDTATRITEQKSDKDHSKYWFEGKEYGKGRLVHAVITHHVEQNTAISIEQLKSDFPNSLQGSVGTIAAAEDAKAIKVRDRARHFLKPDELIDVAGTPMAVSREWGLKNINQFIEHSREFGYRIQQSK